MSKPTDKTVQRIKPFFKNDQMEIATLHSEHMITGFRVIIKGKVTEFIAKDKAEDAITKAFQELEDFIDKKFKV